MEVKEEDAKDENKEEQPLPPLMRQDTPALEKPDPQPEEHKNSQEPEEEQADQDKEEFKDAEPEEEQPEIKKENFDTPRPEEDPHPEEKTESNEDKEVEGEPSSLSMAATQATIETEVTQPNEEDEDIDNKFVLLDRLFVFIEQEGDLNPVLSGYFAKLVSLLISRK